LSLSIRSAIRFEGDETESTNANTRGVSKVIVMNSCLGGADGLLKEYDIDTNGISLHVTEQGGGPAVLFCHGFPDTSYTWRRQMKAVALAGYRAIAPDMRGYGRTSAPADATLYTPLSYGR
jgi:hypothetical protein